ncbi:3-oxo-5a-steroid 4- dehydrogenase [Coemansia aciculifera]|uniref:3-oxo-5a-steroid 4- dehydrogenase n=1 Tax=Coemansia aciculifera TaxID=417176 RepID=A0ACC1M194_9FUNG|nr:3-oxo-5a-steroid 4- dehydrogenase [Coemansia aciculifera]KAJ2910741.1 3-oxo-5a-steroid 4- dehydrogenase [Coemansia aciculifera]
MRINVAKRATPGSADSEKKASSRYPFAVELPDNATVDELKAAIAKQVNKLQPDRQRLTFGEKKDALETGSPLSKYGVAHDDTVYVKDLGPQIGWQTVFYIEYFGPIVFHFIVYNFPSLFYGPSFEHSDVQQQVSMHPL